MTATALFFFVIGIIATLITPCGLAFIPVFAGYAATRANTLRQAVTLSLCFMLGFSSMTFIYGLLACFLIGLLPNIQTLNILVGVILIVSGFLFIRSSHKTTCSVCQHHRSGLLGAFIFGVTFSFTELGCMMVWIIAASTIAAMTGNIFIGSLLMLVFGFGAGVVFVVITPLVVKGMSVFSEKFFVSSRWMNRLVGIVAIIVGLMYVLTAL